MKTRSIFSALTLGVLLAAGSILVQTAFAAEVPFQGSRVTVESSKSFDEVKKALKSMVAKNDMMVMAEVDQGNLLSMTGYKVKAHLFLIGNPTVGKKLFEQDHAVSLYVPLRVSVYVDANDKTIVEYDKPSALLSQFEGEKVGMVAQMLDQKIGALAKMAAQ